MFSHKPISVLSILTVILILLLCSPWAAMAQFSEQRLIPVAVDDPDNVNDQDNNDDAPPHEDPIENAIAQTLLAHDFVVYGRAPRGYPPTPETTREQRDTYVGAGSAVAGILVHVPYGHIPNSLLQEPNSTRMPDLETFFDFGGTLELVVVAAEDSTRAKRDIVISEIMWAVDRGVDNLPGTSSIQVPNPYYDPDLEDDGDPLTTDDSETVGIRVPQLLNQEIQWIELYNTTDKPITEKLYFLFTPFVSHPTRDTVVFDGTTYKVLDSVDTLFTGLWKLPGKSGDRPNTAFVSGYRDIDYDTIEDGELERAAQLAGIPFGANPNSWQATPSNGRRNTDLKIVSDIGEIIELLSISTPGARHVKGIHVGRLTQSSISSNLIVINEVRNDTSTDNVDWVELKNIGSGIQQIKDWELSIVTKEVTDAGLVVLKDTDLVDLPEYELASGEILLLLNEAPWVTPIAAGVNAADVDSQQSVGAPAYVVDSRLNLPNTGKFMLLLRSKFDQNSKDKNIQDYAGNGFFSRISLPM